MFVVESQIILNYLLLLFKLASKINRRFLNLIKLLIEQRVKSKTDIFKGSNSYKWRYITRNLLSTNNNIDVFLFFLKIEQFYIS